LRPLRPQGELLVHLRLLAGRRRDLVGEQTRRLGRLHDLLVTVHPGLERVLDLTTKGGLWLLTRYVTPAEVRAAGPSGLEDHLAGVGMPRPQRQRLAAQAVAAAAAQQLAIAGEQLTAGLVRELAGEALACRARLAELDRDLAKLLAQHPDAALIQSLPGMGATLTAEFLAHAGDLARFASADQLAAAAGLAPVLHQSGKVRFQRRPTGGSKDLKRVFYQSAFCSLRSPDSRAFYTRKRREGQRHHQALIALARRRVNVLWAILHSRQPFQPGYTKAA
jgi:transposase